MPPIITRMVCPKQQWWRCVMLAISMSLVWSVALAADESEDDALHELFSSYAEWDYLSGRLHDKVWRYDDADAQANENRIDFWLGVPDRYHFIVYDDQVDEDRQHYISNGEWRWHVEVVLGDTLVDRRTAHRDDDFAQVQRLLLLNYEQLAVDFTMRLRHLEVPEEIVIADWHPPQDWQAHTAVIMHPQEQEGAPDVLHMVVIFDAQGTARGLLSDDHHGNRRQVTIEELQRHDALDAALFIWSDE
ncbi:MAG: hypothetical protein EA401_01460 [Planctomycetota bacterium]|nr:MAG: hypothetical protein EA401_01460 [Planctomycetota bacterium]